MISLQIAFPEDAEPNGSLLIFGVFNAAGNSKLVSGVRAVEQHFTKLLLTDPGTDLFDLNAGAGITALGRQPVNSDNELAIKNDMALAILDVQNQIIASQLELNLDPSEILVSATPVITYGAGAGWKLEITLVVESGNSAQILRGA